MKSSRVLLGSLIFLIVGFLLGQSAKENNVSITPSFVKKILVNRTSVVPYQTKSEPRATPTVAVTSPQTTEERKKILEEKNLGLLYHRLFNEKEIELEYRKQNFLSELKARFKSPYPTKKINEKVLKQDEFLFRVGILKALDEINSREVLNDLAMKKFYQELTTSKTEEWLVKRQALRNLRKYLVTENQDSVKKFFLKLDPRLLQTAGMSEKEILAGVLEK